MSLPVNPADWTDADWELDELLRAAADPDVPTCDTPSCPVKTYDLLQSFEHPARRICMGCCKAEDARMR